MAFSIPATISPKALRRVRVGAAAVSAALPRRGTKLTSLAERTLRRVESSQQGNRSQVAKDLRLAILGEVSGALQSYGGRHLRRYGLGSLLSPFGLNALGSALDWFLSGRSTRPPISTGTLAQAKDILESIGFRVEMQPTLATVQSPTSRGGRPSVTPPGSRRPLRGTVDTTQVTGPTAPVATPQSPTAPTRPRTAPPRKPGAPEIKPPRKPPAGTGGNGGDGDGGGSGIEMIPAGPSSNVHSYGYDRNAVILYVRYLGDTLSSGRLKGSKKGVAKLRKKGKGKVAMGDRRGEGPLYMYRGVPIKVFERMQDAASKGTFVWDNLRKRGSIWGHQYKYNLVSVTALPGLGSGLTLYVPRRASKSGYRSRKITTISGAKIRSALSPTSRNVKPVINK